jgi:hypothetical protein
MAAPASLPRTCIFALSPSAIVHGHARDARIYHNPADSEYLLLGGAPPLSATPFISWFFPRSDLAMRASAMVDPIRTFSQRHPEYASLGLQVTRDGARDALLAEWRRGRELARALRSWASALCNSPPVYDSALHVRSEIHTAAWSKRVRASVAAMVCNMRAADSSPAQIKEALAPPAPSDPQDLESEVAGWKQYVGSMLASGYVPYRTDQSLWDGDLRLAATLHMQWILASDLAAGARKVHITHIQRSRTPSFSAKHHAFPPIEAVPNCNGARAELHIGICAWLLEAHYGLTVTGMSIINCHSAANPSSLVHPVPDMRTQVVDMLAERAAQIARGERDADFAERLAASAYLPSP